MLNKRLGCPSCSFTMSPRKELNLANMTSPFPLGVDMALQYTCLLHTFLYVPEVKIVNNMGENFPHIFHHRCMQIRYKCCQPKLLIFHKANSSFEAFILHCRATFIGLKIIKILPSSPMNICLAIILLLKTDTGLVM